MNKTLLSVLLCSLYFLPATAQTNADLYAKTDSIVKQLGSLKEFNVAVIADTLTRRFSKKELKARAIFYWISTNISFDLKAIKSNDNRKADPVLVIQTRKATPLGYANLVQEMCSMANIRCLTVDGYTKTFAEDINNPADGINHSWNVVQLGQSPEEWYYIDACRASGYSDKKFTVFTKEFTSGYFFANKTLFNLDHYPDNSAWQLGPGPKNLKDFYSLPVFSNAAYLYGLQKPLPVAGMIKAKTKNTISFSFPHTNAVNISAITLVTGDEKKQEKSQPINFTDNGSVISFNYQFKKEETYPVRIMADGKTLIQYFAEISE